MYRVCILNFNGTAAITTIFNPVVHGWSKRINAPGPMTFSIPAADPKANRTVLQQYNQVELHRRKDDGTGFETVWTGYVMQTKRNGPQLDVICNGLLGIYRKRMTNAGQTFAGQGSTDAFDLLAQANASGSTGVTAGTGGVTTARNTQANGRIEVFRAWEMIAQACGGEFEITDDRAFRFVPTLGQDKTTTILRLRKEGKPGSNVVAVELGASGEPMVNRLHASSSTFDGAGSSITVNDTASQTIYPVLEEARQFNEAGDADTLLAMAQSYLSQRANPITDYRLQPVMSRKSFDILTGQQVVSGFKIGTFSVGDLVTCDILTENEELNEVRRIAEIQVSIGDDGLETVLFTLSKAGIFVTADYLDAGEISDLRRRVRELEQLL
jgi:hypothetical protein